MMRSVKYIQMWLGKQNIVYPSYC